MKYFSKLLTFLTIHLVILFLLLISPFTYKQQVFADTSWKIINPPPTDGSTNGQTLQGVSVISRNDAWAVGFSGYNTLIKHWDGTMWSTVSSPTVGHSQLFSVTAISSNNVWAVGTKSTNDYHDPQTLVEHWDGNTWSVVDSPNPATYSNTLTAVTAISDNNIWAVGDKMDFSNATDPRQGTNHQTLIEHWDGTSWSVINSPNAPTGGTQSVLNTINGTSANDIWAAGSYECTSSQPLLLHYDGSSWNVVTTSTIGTSNCSSYNPNIDSSITGITEISSSNIWAVGTSRVQATGITNSFFMHWDGSQWNISDTPTIPNKQITLKVIKSMSGNDIWTAGNTYDNTVGSQSIIMHYDGTTWTISTSENVGNNTMLLGVDGDTPQDLWAVGNNDSGTITEQYNRGKTPLVFIPGIMGSNFSVKQTFDPGIKDCFSNDYQYTQGDKVFFDINKVITNYMLCGGKYLNVLSLNSNGEDETYPDIQLDSSLVSANTLNHHIGYYDTLPYLTDTAGYTLNKDLFIFPYDWRKDIASSESQLEASISAILAKTGSSKVNILAHSMGGLLARDYIRDATRATHVDTLVEMGTPHAGSVKGLAAILYPTCINWIGLICPLDLQETTTLVQNFPGAFELLPSKLYYQLYSNPNEYPMNDYRDIDNNNVTGPLDYNETKSLLENEDKNMTVFTKAENFHDLLDHSDTNNVTTYMIAGSGINTLGQIVDYKGFQGDIKQDGLATNGDGTVATKSATLNQTDNVFFVHQDHQGLVSNGPALKMAVNLINGQTDLVPGVQRTPFTTLFSGALVSVHSPVAINAYDDQNNHTGLTSDGGFENNIPGSTYDEIGEAKFIYLPTGGHYHITTKATGAGSFDLKIKTYDNSQFTKEKVFINVPQTINTTGSLDLDATNPILTVDENNDGTNIKNIPPMYNLTGDALTDYSGQYTSETSLVASASNNTVTVGKPFTVSVKVTSPNIAFNAVRATATVSSNLSIIGIHNPQSDACNLQYTQTPTKENPSFAGALFGNSSTGCTVYTLTVVPTSVGEGSITLANASVKSYADGGEILEVTHNSNVSITAAQQSPTPTSSLTGIAITSSTETYLASFDLTGTKDTTTTHIFVNGSENGVNFPTDTSWLKTVSLTMGSHQFTVYGADDNGNQTGTKTTTINRHTLGDINGDGVVDLTDASLFANDFDKNSNLTYLLSDMNNDGSADLTDLSILAKLEQ